MNQYIDKAVKRYAALFKLPSHRAVLVELLAICLINGILVATALKFSQYYWLAFALALGVTLFVLTLVSDLLVWSSSQKADPVFNLRRSSALSLYTLMIWLTVAIVGVVVDRLLLTDLWIRFFVLGLCAALALRLLVFLAVSFSNIVKIAVFASLQPILFTMAVVYTATIANALSLNLSLWVFLVISVAVTALAVSLYLFSINRVGVGILGVGSFSVLKAFMATWTEDQNAPFERLFERFSQERNVQLSILSFRNSKGAAKAIVIVPALHPGPFKNIGSSAIPRTIQKTVENKLESCVAMVPHGLSGHDLDLAGQSQNQLVLERVAKLSEISDFRTVATPFLRVKRNGASVGCQAFGGCAFVSLTLAPETMEDLPPELSALILDAAKKNKFLTAIAVDAHNSIQGPFNINRAIKPLQEAAVSALEKTSKQQETSFHVGAARTVPPEFSLGDGMGPGGIAALVVKVGDQTTAYITIDGNNMVKGLREKILAALSEIGINEGEVFTTDTHEVNAVVINARGYHPVGEAMDQELLIKYVSHVTADAVADLEPAQVAWGTETVSGVKVIGQKQIESMCILLDKSMRRAKRSAISVFPIAGAVLVALLLLV
jgi:putative membrane protein